MDEVLNRIMITGCSSMLGRAFKRLVDLYSPSSAVWCMGHQECDLLERDLLEYKMRDFNPTCIVNFAGYNGNISFNRQYPAEIFEKNTLMAVNLLGTACRIGVKNLVSAIPSCSYQDVIEFNQAEKGIPEWAYYEGKPSDSVACHGLAKRNLVAFSEMIYKQYGFQYKNVCLNTVYGPYDNYDISKTKVMGGLIRKFMEAKIKGERAVELWGTGSPLRGFIYCDDAARAIYKVINSIVLGDIINVQSEEITIKNLAELIRSLVKYKGQIIWDTTKPNGQMRKMLDSSIHDRMFELEFSLNKGIEETIKWCTENCEWAKDYNA